MPIEASVLDQDTSEMVQSLFEDAKSVLLVNPAPDIFRAVIFTAVEFDEELPELQVLATPDVLKTATEDFILASRVADLIDDETLELRTTTDIARTSLLVSENQLITIMVTDGDVTGLESTDEEIVENIRSTFMDDWDDGEEFTVRTPPLTQVEETLSEEFDDDMRDDFMMLLESADTVPGEDDELDEVVISLLVAAHNNELLYDISKWGEDTGIASKATFSRTKTQLEDRGMIDTEKVPIDVGRPRLRLKLGQDDLDDIDSLAEGVSA